MLPTCSVRKQTSPSWGCMVACLSNKVRGSNYTAYTGAKLPWTLWKFQLSLLLDSSLRISCIGSCLGPKITYAQACLRPSCSLVAFGLSNNILQARNMVTIISGNSASQSSGLPAFFPAQTQNNVVRTVIIVLDHTTGSFPYAHWNPYFDSHPKGPKVLGVAGTTHLVMPST